jgi:hypothetical protein
MWSAQPVPNIGNPPDSNREKPRLNEIRALHFIWKLDWILFVIGRNGISNSLIMNVEI